MPQHTPYFREPNRRQAGKTFRDIVSDPLGTPIRMMTTCAYPDCGEPHLYLGTPLCIEHAAVVWELFESREPDLHKAHVRDQYKAAMAEREAKKIRIAEARVERSRRPGHIYYLRIGDRIKIGFSTDLMRRLNQYPPNAELLAAHPGTLAFERDMHLRFDMYRTEGREWFSASDALMAHIDEVRAKYPHHTERTPMRKANDRRATIKAQTLARRV